MRRIFDGGYTNYGLGTVHPNGTVYCSFQNKTDKWQVEVWQRTPNGQWGHIRTLRDGRDFFGAPGISQTLCLPDGTLLVLIPLSDPTKAGSVDPHEETILGVAPPFTPQAVYNYPISANDTVARQASEAAVQAAHRAEQIATQAKTQVKADGQKVEQRIGEVVAAAQKAISGAAIDAGRILQIVSDDIASDQGRLRHALWPRVARMTADVIYAQLKDAASPLINVIRQGGQVIK